MRDFIPPAPPDAIAISAVPVPASAPPYDDAPPVPASAPPYDDAPTTAEHGGRRQRSPSPGGSPAEAASPLARPAGRGGGTWPGRFAQVLAETLAGARPPAQLAPWTTQQARKRISDLGPVLAGGRQPRVRRLVSTSPAEGVMELTVVVDLGARVRALAVRLEHDGPAGWRCTAVEAA